MQIEVKATLFLKLDTEEYHIPADLKFRQQLMEDLQDCVESGLSLTVNEVTINKVKKIHDEDECEYSYQ